MNLKEHVACKFNYYIEIEGLLQVAGSHVLSKVVICQKRCKIQLFTWF